MIAGCHSAVGSGLSVIGLKVELIDCVFIQPLCFGNIINMKES
jgi:hypothetical protein